MQWASVNLPPGDIYSSVDDDILLDLIQLTGSVKHATTQMIERGQDWGEFPLVCGFVTSRNEKPVRDFEGEYGKWAITEEEFNRQVFPKYCHGGLYTTTVSVIS